MDWHTTLESGIPVAKWLIGSAATGSVIDIVDIIDTSDNIVVCCYTLSWRVGCFAVRVLDTASCVVQTKSWIAGWRFSTLLRCCSHLWWTFLDIFIKVFIICLVVFLNMTVFCTHTYLTWMSFVDFSAFHSFMFKINMTASVQVLNMWQYNVW